MKNYHTHTYRCHHACGQDEDYVKKAIEAGFSVLGFSDHTPWHYHSQFKPYMRMEDDHLEEYVNSILYLKNKYKDKIKILIGLEVEYFEGYMEWLKEQLENYPIDYIILGHHYDSSDEYGIYYGSRANKEILTRYIDQCIKGMETGLFSYLAHPDLIGYPYADDYYKKEMKRLCLKAKELDIPLEYNLLGYSENRHYPRKEFFHIVSEIGNKVILGYDAHTPYSLMNKDVYAYCKDYLNKLNIEVIDDIKLLRD